MTDLSSLIERIEKSEGADREIDRQIGLAVSVQPAPAYTASIDAAMTLVPEGWSFEVRSSGTGDPGQASVWNPMRAPGHEEYRVSNFATPALALCAAALKARNPSHEG